MGEEMQVCFCVFLSFGLVIFVIYNLVFVIFALLAVI